MINSINVLKNRLSLLIPDSWYLRWQYWRHFGLRLNLTQPRRFTEKIQWLKLYNRNATFPTLVDKYAVRKYVADKIGEEYLIPLLGHWTKPEDIDFQSLPEHFVLKTTHDSGGVIVCQDKNNFDCQDAIEKLKLYLARNVFATTREWPYKLVKPSIIAEMHLTPNQAFIRRETKIMGGVSF